MKEKVFSIYYLDTQTGECRVDNIFCNTMKAAKEIAKYSYRNQNETVINIEESRPF